MDRTFVLIFVAVLLLVAPVSAWWDTDYLYRQEITISNPPSVSDFQAPFTVTYNAHMDADFADVRFVDDDDTTELDYWIEDYTASTSATGYVELADTGSTIYLYYGKSGAASASDGAATFVFFEDFSGDLSQFNTGGDVDGTVEVSSGELHITGTSYWGKYAATKTLFGKTDPLTIEFEYRKPSHYSSGPKTLRIIAVTNSTTCLRDTTYYYLPKYASTSDWDAYKFPAIFESPTYSSSMSSGRVDLDGSGNKRYNLGSWESITDWSYVGSTYDLEFYNGDYGVYPGYFDNIIVRKYAATEPSFAYGSEEEYSAPTPTNKYPDRPAASTTVALPDNASYELLLDFLGSGENWNETSGAGAMNWTALLEAIYYPYNAVFGSLAGVLIFAIPFMMGWIRQRDMTVPGIVGIIFGAFIVLMLPAAYHIVAWTFIAFSVTAVIYSLLKE